MKNSEKGKFEDAWQKAFSNAENAPSEDVWTGVEQSLNKVETIVMKRKVVFYQRLAAASILFALMLGGLSTYYISNLTDNQEKNLTKENSTRLPDGNEFSNNSRASIPSSAEADQKTLSGVDSVMDSEDVSLMRENASHHSSGFIASLFNQSDDKVSITKDSATPQDYKKQPVTRNYPSLLSMMPEPSVELKGRISEVTIVRKLPAMPSTFMKSKNDKQTKENLWASMGASTGNYSPSSDFNSSASSVYYQNSGALTGAQSAYSTTASKGSVFSIGMNLGKRISKKWLVQGGVSYLNQAIGYTSNFALVNANNTALASVADYANAKSFSSVIALSTPYQINSVNEFISVPVQAGYLLVDRKLGLQLNSGVSSDIFMQNTLTDKSGQLASNSSGAGDTSPYRTVSWAGLMGTELSYKIATQYRISIAPGLRYSLNSVLKSQSAPVNPLVWDVGFRFRYIFK
jgi:hypothetical protein